MIAANRESQRRREFRESIERSNERAAKLKQYLEGRREAPSPSTLYRPTHGGFPNAFATFEDGGYPDTDHVRRANEAGEDLSADIARIENTDGAGI